MPERVPKEKRRVAVFGRVRPETKKLLKDMGGNDGRAIDRMAEALSAIVAQVSSLVKSESTGPQPK